MKRELQNVEIPGEYDARRRTWDVVRAAHLEREPVSWPRRHARELALAAAAVALVAAAVTPPGRSVVNSVRERRTQQGKLFYDAQARNATGTLGTLDRDARTLRRRRITVDKGLFQCRQ